MRAAVGTDAGRVAVRDIDDPTPSGADVVVRVRYCGIGGSELSALRDRRADGVVLGHEFTGEVAAIGPDVTEFEVGQRVVGVPRVPCGACAACLEQRFQSCTNGWQEIGDADHPGAFAELVRSHQASLVALPDDLSDRSAALADPLRVGLHAVLSSRLTLDTSCAIIGAGPIGLAVLQAAQLIHAGPTLVIEPSASRRAKALELGASAALDPAADEVAQELMARTIMGPDVVFECSGAAGLFEQAGVWVRPGGQVMLVGLNENDEPIHPSNLILRDITFKGVYGGDDLLQSTVDHLHEGVLQADSLITEVVGLNGVNEVLDRLNRPGGDDIKVLIAPGD